MFCRQFESTLTACPQSVVVCATLDKYDCRTLPKTGVELSLPFTLVPLYVQVSELNV